MSRSWMHFLVIGFAVVFLSSHALGSTCAPFSQITTGSITTAGQSVSCTFSGNASDTLFVITVATSGSLCPMMQLFNSHGSPISSAGCFGGQSFWNTITLPSTDTYTLVISDSSNSNTGTYSTYMQRTNNPTNPVNLQFAKVQTGAISAVTQNNTYTFSANANDTFFIITVLTSGSGSLCPAMQLYGPTGASLTAAGCFGGQSFWNTVTVSTSGTYTLLLRDSSNINAGKYSIYVQRTNDPTNPVNLPFAQVQTGTISAATQNNTYTFNANANDTFFIITNATSGSLCPAMQLYGPTGASLSAAGCFGGQSFWNTVTVPTTGTYTLLLRDSSNTNTGTYDIYVQRTDGPPKGVNLPFAQVQTGSISKADQNNTYTFNANANDTFFVITKATSGSLCPAMQLYGPTGASLSAAGCFGGQSFWNTVTVSTTGKYTLLLRDSSNTNTGTYDIYAQRTNNPTAPSVLFLGQTQSGGVSSATQNNTYTFNASANDQFFVISIATSGSLCPAMQLYGPTGASLSAAGCFGGQSFWNTVTVPTTGAYTLLIRDSSNTNAGKYVTYVQRTNLPFGYSVFGWGGGTTRGSIPLTAQNNTYAFAGTSGNTIDLKAVATSGTLCPAMQLYSPTGSSVAAAGCFGGTSTLNSVSLTQSGIFILLVRDSSNTNTGTYNISGQCFGTCPAMPLITWGMPGPITFGTPLSATQLDATSSVSGTFTYTPKSGTKPRVGPQNLSVLFTPTDTTTYSNAEDSVQLIVNPPPSVTPGSLNFGNQALNQTSGAKIVTLTNAVTGPLTISNIAATSPFAVSATTCGSTLPAGQKCTISVTFTPTALGKVTGTLSVTDNAPNSPQKASLVGTGAVQASLTPASATYAAQKVGTTSPPQTFTLTNNQSVALTSISIGTTGDFAVSSTTCTGSLGAQQHCTISVTFTPTQTGTRTGSLTVSDDANNSPQTSSLTGTGN